VWRERERFLWMQVAGYIGYFFVGKILENTFYGNFFPTCQDVLESLGNSWADVM
jgi:hypothetical protein